MGAEFGKETPVVDNYGHSISKILSSLLTYYPQGNSLSIVSFSVTTSFSHFQKTAQDVFSTFLSNPHHQLKHLALSNIINIIIIIFTSPSTYPSWERSHLPPTSRHQHHHQWFSLYFPGGIYRLTVRYLPFPGWVWTITNPSFTCCNSDTKRSWLLSNWMFSAWWACEHRKTHT